MPRRLIVLIVAFFLISPGCSREAIDRLQKASGKVNARQADDAGPEVDTDPFAPWDDDGPEAARFLQAVKPFYVAVGAGKYDEAYDLLSPLAVHNVHPYQFFDPAQIGDENHPEPPRIESLTKDEFIKRMKAMEAHFGPPRNVSDMSTVTDRDILSGKKQVEASFYIGMVPDSVPIAQRRAAFRGEIRCRYSPEQQKEVMEDYSVTAEQLDADDNDLYPRFKLNTLLIEENGTLKVGYFECAPEHLLD